MEMESSSIVSQDDGSSPMSAVQTVLETIENSTVDSRASLTALGPAADVDFTNVELLSEFKERKAALTTSHKEYLSQHPELRNLMADYTQLLLQRKPEDVFAFTKAYFTKEESVAGVGKR